MKADQLRDRWALVTGASSGLGADLARLLASQGCHVVLTARRADRLADLQEEITSQQGVEAISIPLDLSVIAAPGELYDHIKTAGIPIDVLINNAGFGICGEFLHTEWKRQQDLLVLNIISLTHLTRLFAAGMVARNFGFILNVASNSAFQPTPRYATYGASKSFVLNFSQALNYELRHTRVKCTALSPGTMATEYHQVAGQRVDRLYYRLTRMDSMAVAQAGLRAMLKGRPSLVVDWKIAIISWFSQRAPQRWSTAVAGWMIGPGTAPHKETTHD